MASGPNAVFGPSMSAFCRALSESVSRVKTNFAPASRSRCVLQLVVAEGDAGEAVGLAGLPRPLGLGAADQPRPGAVQEEVARRQGRVLLGLRLRRCGASGSGR